MTPNTPEIPRLPNVHPEVYDRAQGLLRALAEAPMSFAKHQEHAGTVRMLVQYAEGLEGRVTKLGEEIAALKQQPAKE